MNIPELIKEAKRRSRAAQKCLFDEFADKMMIVCRRYMKTSEDAEELMLDGFYKFFSKPGPYYKKCYFKIKGNMLHEKSNDDFP